MFQLITGGVLSFSRSAGFLAVANLHELAQSLAVGAGNRERLQSGGQFLSSIRKCAQYANRALEKLKEGKGVQL